MALVKGLSISSNSELTTGEDITTLITFFLVSSGSGLTLYLIHKCLLPSPERIDGATREKGTPSIENTHILQQLELAKVILIASYTLCYYSVSISFTIMNKYFLNSWEGGFSFPITSTTGHMIIKLALTRIWALHPDVVILPISQAVLFWIVIPIGAATAFDVMLSNSSLLFINLSMYTIIKSTSVVNIYFLGIFYGLEPLR